MEIDPEFAKLAEFIEQTPACSFISASLEGDQGWWAKLSIDITDDLAWHVVQEYGFVLNYISLDERLPTVFKPVSPPPYANGGPAEFLSWVIECRETAFSPDLAAEWLEARLPRPVTDRKEWRDDE